MSLDFLTRPIGGRKNAEPDPARPRRRSSLHPEDVRRPGALAIGGEPRVDLMPPEVRVKRAQLRTRRSLRLGLVAVVAVVALGCGGSVAWSALAGVNLTLAQAQANGLVLQQGQYGDVKTTLQSIHLIETGQRIGASTEIDWNDYFNQVAALLPAGVSIAGVNLDQATPIAPYQEDIQLLQGDRIARLTVVTESAFIPPVAQILASMEHLRGFVDVAPSQVVWETDKSLYKATMTVDLDIDAFDGRFQSAPAGGSR